MIIHQFILTFLILTTSFSTSLLAFQPKVNKAERLKQLTPFQKKITQKDGTETPFKNKYFAHKEKGIYVDIVLGEPLFSSTHKYDSKTGWPSFYRPINKEKFIVEKKESALLWRRPRIEVRSKISDSHLGHVFTDGPKPTGLRYCINSAALEFIPVSEMKKRGYGDYLYLFGLASDKKTTEKITNSPYETSYLAGGCFWGMQDLLKKLKGVHKTSVGYIGGDKSKARYSFVKTGLTQHAEAVKVEFDPGILSYRDLLIYYFRIHDPTTLNQQGNDKGPQYRSAIFYTSKEQKKVAEKLIDKLTKIKAFKNQSITTKVESAGEYTLAENEHQDYLDKNPNGYTCHHLRPQFKGL